MLDLFAAQNLKDFTRIFAAAVFKHLETTSEQALSAATRFLKSCRPTLTIDPSDMSHKIEEQRNQILPWCAVAAVYVHVSGEIEERAEDFMALGVKSADAVRLACAESAGCDWFLTVDKGILKKVHEVGNMRVANPMDYIQEEG